MAKEEADIAVILLAWVIFSAAVAMDMYFIYLSNVMKGMGKVKENAVIAIVVSAVSSVLKVVFILLGWELMGLAAAYFLQLLINRILLYWYMNTDLKQYKKPLNRMPCFNRNSSTYRAIMHNSMIIVFFLLGMLCGGMAVHLFGDFVLTLIHSETKLLGSLDILLLTVYQAAAGVLKICTVYIQYHNEQPYTASTVAASVLSVAGAVPVMMLGYGIRGYLAVLIMSQAVYNLWKWPFYCYRLLDMHLLEMPERGIKYMIGVMKGKL